MSLSFDLKGLLVPSDKTRIVLSSRSSVFDVASGDKPLALVWQLADTASPAVEQADRIRRYRPIQDAPVSWHFLVANDGVIYQSVPVLLGSWHTPRPGRVGGKLFGNVSRATLGIRLEQGQSAAQAAACDALLRLLAVRFKLPRVECARTSGSFYSPPRDEPWRAFLDGVLQEVFGKEAV